MENIGSYILVAALGLVIGGVLGWLLTRSDHARTRSDIDKARLEAEQARAQIADARADVATARAETANSHRDVSEAAARVAELHAEVRGARAERDAAISRAQTLAADREALAKEFRLLSASALEEQTRRAETSAEQRFKATEQLMAPVRESLDKYNQRLNEVERMRVEMQTDLRNHVSAVRVTGDELRRETNALSTALRKPQVRGAWGELQLKRVAEIAGMVEHCDFLLQETSTTSDDRTIRPDMKVMLGDGKFVYVDSKVPLTSFQIGRAHV